MNTQSFAGLALIAGFILILFGSFAGPPGLYQEPDPDARLQIIADHQGRWTASNVGFILAGILTAAGLAAYAWQARDSAQGWLVVTGLVVFLLGSAAWVFFIYRRTVDPAYLFTSYAFSPLTVFLFATLVIGLLLFGFVYLQTGYPRWLGISTIAGMVLIGGLALVFPAGFFNNFPPQALFLFTLAAGIVILRQ